MSVTNEELVRYLKAMEDQEATRVRRAMETLTPREAFLVREAAVMGYVQGQADAKAGYGAIPRDSTIVRYTVLGCISQNDSNPQQFRLIAAAAEGRRPRASRGESA